MRANFWRIRDGVFFLRRANIDCDCAVSPHPLTPSPSPQISRQNSKLSPENRSRLMSALNYHQRVTKCVCECVCVCVAKCVCVSQVIVTRGHADLLVNGGPEILII